MRLMSEDPSTGSNSLHLEPLRSDSRSSERTLFNMSDTEDNEKRRSGDLEKEGVEGSLPTVEIKDHVTEDPLARIKLLWWMFVNTVATVMIVSYPIHDGSTIATAKPLSFSLHYSFDLSSILTKVILSTGVLQQSHIQRQIIRTMSSRLRLLPLLRHSVHPLHPLPPHLRHVRTQTHPRHEHAPPRRRHGHEHRRHEPLPPSLHHHVLPNHPGPPHTSHRNHQLLLLQEIHSENGRLRPYSNVLWCGSHLILRPKACPGSRCASKSCRRINRDDRNRKCPY